MAEFNIFNRVNNLSMGSVTIKTVAGPDHSQTTLNVNPYTNHGQHVSGGRIDNYSEGRRTVSAQEVDTTPIIPESKPNPERVQSAPSVLESQPTSSLQPTSLQPTSLQPTSLQPLRPTSPIRTPSDVNAADAVFPELWILALQQYKEKTGVDLQDRKNEFVQRFDECQDSGDALGALEALQIFKKPGARTTWVKIKDSLKKVLDVVIILNTLVAEVGNMVIPHFGKLIFVGTGLLLRATKDITKQTDTLEKLFSRLAAFLSRLEVRERASIQPSSKRIIIRILAELLNSLAIATVMVRGKFWHRVKSVSKKLLFDDDEIEKALSRLSDLTEEESAMVLAELAASRSDFDELAREVGGLDNNIRVLASQIRSVIAIDKLDDKELHKLYSVLQSTENDKTEVLQVLQLLKIENDGTQSSLNRIETEVQELRKSLARNSSSNGQAVRETSENGDSSGSSMNDAYDTYANYGQHITGGNVKIHEPQTTAPPVNFSPPSRPPVRPAPAGSSKDAYGYYSNYGQHVTGGEVVITRPKTNVQGLQA